MDDSGIETALGMFVVLIACCAYAIIGSNMREKACMNAHNVSSCEVLYIPNTASEVIEEFTLD
jgi:hypothetical protein